MKIRTFYRVENGVYRVSIHTEEWSENDIRLMEKFGEPEINIGAHPLLYIPPEDPDERQFEYEMPDEYRRIKSDPISASFDSKDSPYAKEFANLWADYTIGDISAAFTVLHNHYDDFTRETVNTLSAS